MINERIFLLKPPRLIIIFVVLDVFCMAMGMGLPVFNIMFGFVIGWYILNWISIRTIEVNEILKQLLIYSCITAGVTFLGMLLIWGWSVKFLFGSERDLANFGIPLILFEPRMSLVGWLVLMIAISPFLQLLTTVFAGHLTLLSLHSKRNASGDKSPATA